MRSIILLLVFGVLGFLFYESSSFLEAGSGIAIFLYGIMCLKNGFGSFSTFIERVLKKWANTATKSLIFGAISTMIMQSSGLVSVLAISFLAAGFITLGQGIGIIFGANLGTTIVAWVIAIAGVKFDISSACFWCDIKSPKLQKRKGVWFYFVRNRILFPWNLSCKKRF